MIPVDDIHIKNKPSVIDADIVVALGNKSGVSQDGEITIVVHEWKRPDNIIWVKFASHEYSIKLTNLRQAMKHK